MHILETGVLGNGTDKLSMECHCIFGNVAHISVLEIEVLGGGVVRHESQESGGPK